MQKIKTITARCFQVHPTLVVESVQRDAILSPVPSLDSLQLTRDKSDESSSFFTAVSSLFPFLWPLRYHFLVLSSSDRSMPCYTVSVHPCLTPSSACTASAALLSSHSHAFPQFLPPRVSLPIPKLIQNQQSTAIGLNRNKPGIVIVHGRLALGHAPVLMKKNINCELKKISIPVKGLLDKISSALNFWLPELIEEMRLNVTTICQRNPNIKNGSTQTPGWSTCDKYVSKCVETRSPTREKAVKYSSRCAPLVKETMARLSLLLELTGAVKLGFMSKDSNAQSSAPRVSLTM
jgi:hypothetical protein